MGAGVGGGVPLPVIIFVISGAIMHSFSQAYALKDAWWMGLKIFSILIASLPSFSTHVFREQEQSIAFKAQTGKK